MPTRLTTFAIGLFWVGIMTAVFLRDVLPYWNSDRPPAVRIELSDEATQTVPITWGITRNDTRVGTVRTTMSYSAEENLFRLTSVYRELVYNQGSVRCRIPEMTTVMAVNRQGDFRGQTMTGKIIIKVVAGPITLFEADANATIESTVVDEQLVGHVKAQSPLGEFDEPLDPTPVQKGQVLNPLQPVNRLTDIRPGQSWLIHENNPLGDALRTIGQKFLKAQGSTVLSQLGQGMGQSPPLLATVRE
ncbi:MAG: hypothetical protein ACRCZF_05585, partial [Gemmataceae bacterium]